MPRRSVRPSRSDRPLRSGSPVGSALAVIILALGLTSIADAAPRLVDAGVIGSSDQPRVQVLSSESTGLRLEFELPALVQEEAEVGGQTVKILAIPGGSLEGVEGEPGIPVFTRLVAIPADAALTVSAVAGDETSIDGVRLAPVVADEAGKVTALDPAAYSRSGFGAASAASVGPPALLRGLRVVPLTIRPVRYDPARGVIEVAGRVTVEIRFDGTDPRNVAAAEPRPLPASFDRLAREVVLNYAPAAKSGLVENGSWLVICPNDAAVIQRLQPLLDWRKRQGYATRLATMAETGGTASFIKLFIQNAYDAWPVPPEFVVLAGDASGTYNVPTWYESLSGYGGEGDHPYTLLSGDDPLSDIHLGRLSFNTLPELETIVAKIVGYESAPFTTDPWWFTAATLVGDPGASGYSTIQVMQWIKTRLREVGYSQVDTVFNGAFVPQMQVALNHGNSIFSYRGYWGMSGWTNANTFALQNGARMPFAAISTCGTGSFAAETSINEGFLRAGTPTAPRGAVAATATATLGTHTRFNNCFIEGIMQGLLYEGLDAVGAAETRGKVQLYLNYGNTPWADYVTIFSHWNNLMGDPATECWTGFPGALSVVHPDTLSLGQSDFQVTVTDAGLPCPGARVCLWKSGNVSGPEISATGWTDATGHCDITASIGTGGAAALTVSKHNRRPYLATLPVAARASFVGWSATAVDDDNLGESLGNGDGNVNPGETIELRVRLKNHGSQPAPAVTALLTSGDPYLVLTDTAESFGDLAAGQGAWCADDFGFTVAAGCPDGHVLRLDLLVSSGGHTWPAALTVPVRAAAFAVVSTSVPDGGNGSLDPGETADLVLTLANAGAADAIGVTGTLLSSSPWVEVMDGAGTFGNIAVGAEGANSADRFTLRSAAGAFPGHRAALSLVTDAAGPARDTVQVALTVGVRTAVDPTGPDAHGYFAFDDTDAAYPWRPVYNWVELDPALGGNGVEVTLGDYGTYQDKTTTVPLPFPFRFYGAEKATASICSNGWLALTPSYLTDYRNWTIPGAGAPSDLVSVFWDDLYQDGSSRAFTRYDAVNHRWVAEWSRFRNAEDGSVETFEVILFDPLYYPTDTGDGKLLFQYKDVANVDPVDGYATVGIENSDHEDGLLYTYFNAYPAGAAPLAPGRALLFLPLHEGPRGAIQGIVRNASLGGAPLAGALVTFLPAGPMFHSAADGAYGGEAPAGSVTVVASREGFAADTVNAVVPVGQALALDFSLLDNGGPLISGVDNPGHRLAAAGALPLSAEVRDASGVAGVTLRWRSDYGAWNSAPMTGVGDLYAATLPAFVAGSLVEYYVEATDGAGLVSTDPPGAPAAPFTLLVTEVTYTNDGESGAAGWALGLPQDTATSGTWILADPIGMTYGGQLVQPEDDHTAVPGTKCFVTGNTGIGSDPEADVDNGCTSLRSITLDLSGATHAWLTYWRWYGQYGLLDDEFAVNVSNDGGATWAALERVPGNANEWRTVTVDLAGFVSLTAQVVVRFQACDLGGAAIVEAAIDDLSLEAFHPAVTGVTPGPAFPAATRLLAARPNPAAGGAVLRFALARTAAARLTVHDVGGRLVRRLVDGVQPAGETEVRWDGRDEDGRPVAAGVYLYNLETAGYRGSEKLLLLR